MQIMLIVKLIGKALVEHVNFLVICLCLGLAKSKILFALSTLEAEYIAAGSCCAQILWIKQQLSDFGVTLHNIPIFFNNISAINITKNHVQHSRTKHMRLDIILLEIMHLKVTFVLNMLILLINLLIFSPNP